MLHNPLRSTKSITLNFPRGSIRKCWSFEGREEILSGELENSGECFFVPPISSMKSLRIFQTIIYQSGRNFLFSTSLLIIIHLTVGSLYRDQRSRELFTIVTEHLTRVHPSTLDPKNACGTGETCMNYDGD